MEQIKNEVDNREILRSHFIAKHKNSFDYIFNKLYRDDYYKKPAYTEYIIDSSSSRNVPKFTKNTYPLTLKQRDILYSDKPYREIIADIRRKNKADFIWGR